MSSFGTLRRIFSFIRNPEASNNENAHQDGQLSTWDPNNSFDQSTEHDDFDVLGFEQMNISASLSAEGSHHARKPAKNPYSSLYSSLSKNTSTPALLEEILPELGEYERDIIFQEDEAARRMLNTELGFGSNVRESILETDNFLEKTLTEVNDDVTKDFWTMSRPLARNNPTRKTQRKAVNTLPRNYKSMRSNDNKNLNLGYEDNSANSKAGWRSLATPATSRKSNSAKPKPELRRQASFNEIHSIQEQVNPEDYVPKQDVELLEEKYSQLSQDLESLRQEMARMKVNSLQTTCGNKVDVSKQVVVEDEKKKIHADTLTEKQISKPSSSPIVSSGPPPPPPPPMALVSSPSTISLKVSGNKLTPVVHNVKPDFAKELKNAVTGTGTLRKVKPKEKTPPKDNPFLRTDFRQSLRPVSRKGENRQVVNPPNQTRLAFIEQSRTRNLQRSQSFMVKPSIPMKPTISQNGILKQNNNSEEKITETRKFPQQLTGTIQKEKKIPSRKNERKDDLEKIPEKSTSKENPPSKIISADECSSQIFLLPEPNIKVERNFKRSHPSSSSLKETFYSSQEAELNSPNGSNDRGALLSAIQSFKLDTLKRRKKEIVQLLETPAGSNILEKALRDRFRACIGDEDDQNDDYNENSASEDDEWDMEE